ncbi:MAG: DNA polymerase I [Candidatus Margulisbacteria bacterium]|nr:DNA polymerase I [Candidatus Margulisiibacteriota bacterium]
MPREINNSKVVLIDGNSLAYRAFYALPDTMRTATGITTNAIYGFTTMLIKILEDNPDFVAISFDRPEPTFRHKEYKEYKATREKAPPTLHEQIPYVKEVAAAFEIPIYEIAGFEADDVIGTLAKEAEKQGHDVIILSGDLDPLQLVNDKIKVLTTRKGITDTILYGAKEVEERYDGLRPDQLIDYKALKGDTSDNIPGVPKVGEKTAVELLKEFGTLESIYNNVDSITKKSVRETLKNNLHLAELSKRLGTIVTDVPLEIDFAKAKRTGINWEKALPTLKKFEFDSLVKKHSQGVAEFDSAAVISKKREELADFNFKAVKSDQELDQLLTLLNKADSFAFDLETTGLDVFTAEIVGISFCFEPKSAWYLPFKHSIPRHLDTLFLSNKLKIGHNLKYDIEVLKNNGIKVAGPYFDTMVAAYLLDPISGKYSLKHLAKQFLGRDMLKFAEVSENLNFAEVPEELAVDYACSDAEATFALAELFKLALKGQKLDKLFNDIEMPLLEALIEMELNGISVDVKLLAKMSAEMATELKDLERHIYAIAGEVFNINSTKQLGQILFIKLMLPVIKKGKTGPSTDAEVLEELAAQKFEIAEKLLTYRQLTKLKNTYIDVLPTLIRPKTGRIHSSFNQTITATGRLSSSDPNLQNIPAKGDWGKRIRTAFIPGKKDWVMLAADYSQIELRILAHLSNDPVLLKAFNEDKDIHQSTANELGISRDAAKTVNFGVIYGISDFGLAKQLGIKRTEAAAYINKYFDKHQGVKLFIEKTINEAKENGFVTTMLGRKRPMPDINSPHGGLRQSAERMAINTPVQGTAADMIKVAMVNTLRALRVTRYSSRLILQVHDELVFECPKDEVEKVKPLVEEAMVGAIKLSVPVKVDIGVGQNWAETKS